MHKNMQRIVRYYLDDAVDLIHESVLAQLAGKLDDTDYTYCCFWAHLMSTYEHYKMVYKNFLLSDKVWDRFLDSRFNRIEQVKIRSSIALERFHVESQFYGPDEVVRDEKIKLMPIIRYTMGLSLNLPEDYYMKYKEPTKMQLREEPLYFDVLTKLIEYFPITKEEVMRNE